MRIIKALADENRLRMLKLLQQRGLCVCELQGALGLNQSNASRHLSRLKDVGLVTQTKDGQWIYYAISEAKLAEYPFVKEILEQALREDSILIEAMQVVRRYEVEGNPCAREAK